MGIGVTCRKLPLQPEVQRSCFESSAGEAWKEANSLSFHGGQN